MSCHCDLLFFNKTFRLVFPVRILNFKKKIINKNFFFLFCCLWPLCFLFCFFKRIEFCVYFEFGIWSHFVCVCVFCVKVSLLAVVAVVNLYILSVWCVRVIFKLGFRKSITASLFVFCFWAFYFDWTMVLVAAAKKKWKFDWIYMWKWKSPLKIPNPKSSNTEFVIRNKRSAKSIKSKKKKKQKTFFPGYFFHI